MISKVK